jgi:pimeloyl-ACP methyl ester carboxylesterase
MEAAMDLMVTTGPVPVAVRDHGGDGPPVLLLHGAGGNLAHWSTLAPALTARHRVVAVDLRGHGRSGDGPWDWHAVCADLDAVVAELGLDNPAVVGHSLGGLVAVEWARRQAGDAQAGRADGAGWEGGDRRAGGCRAVVNLDGHPALTRVEQCPGLEAGRAAELLGQLSAAFDAVQAAMAAPMAAGTVEGLVTAQAGLAERYGTADGRVDASRSGLDEAARRKLVEVVRRDLEEGARRGVVERDGAWWVRPDAKLTGELRVAMAEVDPYPAYRRVGCPVLVVLAGRDLPEQRPFAELTEAYRGLLRDRFAELAAELPELRVVELPASHAMLLEAPDRVLELVAHAVA